MPPSLSPFPPTHTQNMPNTRHVHRQIGDMHLVHGGHDDVQNLPSVGFESDALVLDLEDGRAHALADQALAQLIQAEHREHEAIDATARPLHLPVRRQQGRLCRRAWPGERRRAPASWHSLPALCPARQGPACSKLTPHLLFQARLDLLSQLGSKEPGLHLQLALQF